MRGWDIDRSSPVVNKNKSSIYTHIILPALPNQYFLASTFDGFCGQKVPDDQRRTRNISQLSSAAHETFSHVVVISSNRKRETALNLPICSAQVGVLERTTGQHCFLRAVESDRAELLPIADELVFHYYFVDCQFTLCIQYQHLLFPFVLLGKVAPTSRKDSIGT